MSLQQIFGCAPTPCFYWDRSPDYAFGTRKVSNSGAPGYCATTRVTYFPWTGPFGVMSTTSSGYA